MRGHTGLGLTNVATKFGENWSWLRFVVSIIWNKSRVFPKYWIGKPIVDLGHRMTNTSSESTHFAFRTLTHENLYTFVQGNDGLVEVFNDALRSMVIH
ncbi:uncharacterized protein CMC5_060290 [Chondromyces crocatus]|uniref:Uncharacterized protein n=1 Tax=Chondromyces crocatus TaxID=52 RepID=A0A0K1EMF8_CHOCO|nr:uncharacterized protein CMC5_060290 [Chondromyces crocatus]